MPACHWSVSALVSALIGGKFISSPPGLVTYQGDVIVWFNFNNEHKFSLPFTNFSLPALRCYMELFCFKGKKKNQHQQLYELQESFHGNWWWSSLSTLRPPWLSTVCWYNAAFCRQILHIFFSVSLLHGQKYFQNALNNLSQDKKTPHSWCGVVYMDVVASEKVVHRSQHVRVV